MNNLTDHVTSLELSQRLRELKVKQESHLHWVQLKLDSEPYLYRTVWEAKKLDNVLASAFLASELGDMVPYEINNHYMHIHKCFVNVWEIVYLNDLLALKQIPLTKSFTDNFLPNCLAKMLIHLIENNRMGDEWKAKWLEVE